MATIVKNTLTDSLVQILSPNRRVDILRDCLEAKKNRRPFVMSFCGVSLIKTDSKEILFVLILFRLQSLIYEEIY